MNTHMHHTPKAKLTIKVSFFVIAPLRSHSSHSKVLMTPKFNLPPFPGNVFEPEGSFALTPRLTSAYIRGLIPKT